MAEPTGLQTQIPDFGLPREGKTAPGTGLADAHAFGKDFVNTIAVWLKQLFPGAGSSDASWPWNFSQTGESKGTAAAMATAVHAGQQLGAYDALVYDTSPQKAQILNSLQSEFNAAGSDRAKIFNVQQRVIALAYYLKYLELNQELLPPGEKSLPFNGADYRFSDPAAYLESVRGKFTL